jgi:hypothetical protein
VKVDLNSDLKDDKPQPDHEALKDAINGEKFVFVLPKMWFYRLWWEVQLQLQIENTQA